MSKQKKPGKTGDPETDEVLAEMEEQDEALPSFGSDDEEEEEEETPDSETDEEEDEEEEEESEDDADDEEEDEEEDSKAELEEEEEDDEEDSDEEDAEEGDDEEEGEDDGKKKPVWKRLKEEKTKRKAAENLLAELQGKQSQEQLDKKLTDFAAKHKMNIEVARSIVELAAEMAAQKVGIDPETKKQLQEVAKSGEKQKFWDRQDALFEQEFGNNVAPLAQRDGQKLKKLRAQLHGLAFKPENAKKSLVQLYLEVTKGTTKPGKKITSESGRSTSRRSVAADLNDLSDINNLSDDAFDEASDALAKNSKSRIRRRGSTT